MPNAIAYLRVSSREQARDGESLEAQERAIRAWCASNYYQLAAVYRDEGISGGKMNNRPGLQAALNDVCAQAGTALVVYSMSRVARSTKDAISISERLDKACCDWVSLTEKIDTTSAAGKLLFRIMAVMAEFERDVAGERTRAIVAMKREKGERLGMVPYGYTSVGNKLVPSEREQEVIGLICRLRGEGLSLQAIGDRLAQEGIPNRRGKLKWRLNTIGTILRRTGHGNERRD